MKPRVCSVSYLNSTPLVWGLLHGPQQGALDLRLEIPSACAALLRSGAVDIGLVPIIELDRQNLKMLPGLGIASSGAVRSILLISKVEAAAISTLAADASSRTSVVLARILLHEKFHAAPRVMEASPHVEAMLQHADACLVIGDPALRVNTQGSGLYIYDLGREWTDWSGLPMVYAAWAARAEFDWQAAQTVLAASWEYGRERILEIAREESGPRGISETVAFEYLTRNIEFALSDNHMEGLALYRRLAQASGLV